MLTLTGAGMVVLRAAQDGNDTYAPAPPVDQVLLIAPGNNLISDVQRLANGMFTFRFYGEPGTNYVVQASSNLVTWTALATNQVSALGYFEFTDVGATNYSKRFYRIAPVAALPSGGPMLTLALHGNEVVVSWPTNDAGFVLETTTNLSLSGWATNAITPGIVNGQFTATNGVPSGNRFYRLRR